MKVAALDCVWYDLPLEKRLKHIADLGFKGVEFWLTAAELGYDPAPEWPSTHEVARLSLSPRELAKLVDNVGLKIVGFGQYAFMGHYPTVFDPPEIEKGRRREKRIEDIKSMLTYAAETGAKYVIGETGGDPAKSEQWKIVVDVVRQLVDHAEKVGAVLAVENTPQMHIATPDAQLRLMKEIDSKALRVLYDPANLNLTPPGKWNLPGIIKKLKEYIALVHAKDSVYHEGPYGRIPDDAWDCPPIGKGQVPWPECLEAFKEIGYDGYLIVEYAPPVHAVRREDRETGAIEGLRYLEGLLKKKGLQ